MTIISSGATVEINGKPLFNWETASQEEVIEQINTIHHSFSQSVQLEVQGSIQIPMRVYKMLFFKRVFTRVRKGPAKGRRKMLMVK